MTAQLRRTMVPALAAALAGASLAVALAGCSGQIGAGTGGVAGVLARLRPLESACHGASNGYFGIDIDSSDPRNKALTVEHLAELREMSDHVAACGGEMKIVSFAGSAAATTTLAEAAFPTSGGTDTARLIQANRTLQRLLNKVETGLPRSRQERMNNTQVLAQLVLAQQFQMQRDEGTLSVELATAGVGSYGAVQMASPKFTEPVAARAASHVPVPNLAGARVRIVGIGRTTGQGEQSLPTNRVEDLITFYTIACRRTGASRCLITTDYTQGR